MKKCLRDYPFREWMEAADGCEECGAKYQVKITHVDSDGISGNIEWRIRHKKHCSHRFDEAGEEHEVEEGEDIAGWEFMPKPFTFRGKQYYPLKSRANIGPCLECGKLVVGVPIILFINKGKGGELDFCFECAKELGILREGYFQYKCPRCGYVNVRSYRAKRIICDNCKEEFKVEGETKNETKMS